MSAAQRAILGFVAAVLSVLLFHQGILLVMRETGLLGIPRSVALWNLAPNARAFGLPSLVNLCFWGGLYGAAFGLLSPRFRLPMWVCGVLTGVVAALVGFFIVAALRGGPLGGGWRADAWARSLLINGSFGLGLGLIYPLLAARVAPRPLRRR